MQESKEETINEEETPATTASPEEIIKHPLEHSWTLWYYHKESPMNWQDNQQKVLTVNTVEDFWSMYHYTKSASKLSVGADYSFFKDNIKPVWEDIRNAKGGRWLLILGKARSDLDNLWLELLMSMIGEGFDDCNNSVCGAVLNVRPRQDKIALWTDDHQNYGVNLKIGHILKDVFRLSSRALGYQDHGDPPAKSSNLYKFQI